MGKTLSFTGFGDTEIGLNKRCLQKGGLGHMLLNRTIPSVTKMASGVQEGSEDTRRMVG
jgi:hypothetical protein